MKEKVRHTKPATSAARVTVTLTEGDVTVSHTVVCFGKAHAGYLEARGHALSTLRQLQAGVS